MSLSISKSNNKIILAQYVCSALFLLLCLLHFFSQRTLWLDEGFILDNIKSLQYPQLFGPLEHAQAFPRVYLAIIKFFSSPFNYHVLSLRFMSLVTMLGAYFVWGKVFKKALTAPQFILALFTFTCSYFLSYYAAEFKPYSMDVLIVGLFCWFLINQKEWVSSGPSFKAYILISIMPLALFLSYASFFVFWIVGYNFLFMLKENKRILPLLALYSFLSVGALALIYFFDLRHSWGDSALMSYWDSYFVCTKSLGCFSETVWEGVRRLSAGWYGEGKFFLRAASFLIPIFVYSLIKYGFGAWIKNKGRVLCVGSLASVLFVELFVFGVLQKYPFTGARITLFLAPVVFFCVIKGIEGLKRIKYLYYSVLGAYVLLLAASYVNTFINYVRLYGM